jgi:site-specific DNA-methyltransferase (cytosine-N4-specific)
MGDAYAGSWGAQGRQGEGGQVAGRSACAERQIAAAQRRKANTGSLDRADGLKNKDLMGQPWRLAFALQDAGWWLRQEIIWSKPNPMPESVRDRCTKAHEHIFLLTKAERYYWNFDGSQEPVSGGANPRRPGNGVGFGHGYDPVTKPRAVKTPAGWATGTDRAHDEVLGRYTEHRRSGKYGDLTGGDDDGMHRTKAGLNLPTPKAALATADNNGAYAEGKSERMGRGAGWRVKNNASMDKSLSTMPNTRNPRSVWTIPTQSYSGSHFATFPEALVERCLIPGCPPGGTVLDIFLGSGTTAQVAQRLGMNWIGIDLDLRNEALQRDRIGGQAALILEHAA